MEDDFVNVTQALALKELGFTTNFLGYFDNNGELCANLLDVQFNEEEPNYKKDDSLVDAPLKSQVLKWFRDKHEMFPIISTFLGEEIPKFKGKLAHFWEINMLVGIISEEPEIPYKTYEEAESACIDKLIEIVKEKL
jgi:hypothetical protein